MFVPAHVDASADVKGLVRYNRDKVHEVGGQDSVRLWEANVF